MFAHTSIVSLAGTDDLQEIKANMIDPVNTKATFTIAEIQDGDIICFQKAISDAEFVVNLLLRRMLS